MYCPLCGQQLEEVKRRDPQEQYREAYAAWVDSGAFGNPPPLPDESVHFTCERGCFTEATPLIQHHGKGDAKSAPSGTSWSLTCNPTT